MMRTVIGFLWLIGQPGIIGGLLARTWEGETGALAGMLAAMLFFYLNAWVLINMARDSGDLKAD